MREVLVIANRTLGGTKLREAVRERAAAGDVRFRLVVPQTKPSAGLVIYDEAVRESAQVRVDLALSAVAAEGIKATGEVGDADPFSATMDAIAQHRPDEIILSTYPAQHSGWMRRDLVERVSNAAGVPVEHIVADIDQEGLSFRVTLVVSHKTSSGEELLAHLIAKASEDEPRLFIAVVPQLDGSGNGPREARERLASMLDRLHGAGLLSSGMIGDPDPYTATMNALELFHVDDVVISTLPGERSGWMRSHLIERVRSATAVPVEHVVVDPQAATVASSAG
jgi:hypothetical protein